MRKNIKIARLKIPPFKDLPVGTLVIISDERNNPDAFALAIVFNEMGPMEDEMMEAIVIQPYNAAWLSPDPPKPWKAGERISSFNPDILVIPVTQTVFGQLYDGQPFMQYGDLWRKTGHNEGINAEGRTERFQSIENVYAIDAQHVVTFKPFEIKPRTLEDLKALPKGHLVIVRDPSGNYALGTFERNLAADSGEVSVKRSISVTVSVHTLKPYDTPWRKKEILFYTDEDALDKTIPVTEDSFGLIQPQQLFMHKGELWRKTMERTAISEYGEKKEFELRTDVFGIDEQYTN